MSMEIMGLSAAFAQAACVKKAKNKIELIFSDADQTIYKLSCNGDIAIKSIKNDAPVTAMYSDLEDTEVSIQADANTRITIAGDVTKLAITDDRTDSLMRIDVTKCKTIESLDLENQVNLYFLDVSQNIALTYLSCSGCEALTSLDLSANTNLTSLDCSVCQNLALLYLPQNSSLTSLNCNSCTGLIEIKYPATNEDVSTAIADAITAATDAYGTVYTDSEGAYYNTIATAATAKGWTIEQLA